MKMRARLPCADITARDPSLKNNRIEKVIEQCSLKTVLNKPIGKLSRGFRQRVGMANVLLHEPEVLIMDEPTAGLDPNQVLEVRKTIKGLGKTILLSTHILQEVPQVADRIILIDQGRLVFDDDSSHPMSSTRASQGGCSETMYC